MREREAKTLFFDLLELPADRHAAYIESACAGDQQLRSRVEALLKAHHEAEGFLGDTSDESLIPTLSIATASQEPETPKQIGPYEVVRSLGQGGFGTVYLCKQHEPIERQIAVKVLRPGMDSQTVLRRFEEERILLSKMNHPGIARVLDAGRTEQGRPFIAMEYIDGDRITTYCDEHHLNLRARLELFAQACLAIQHAHQKGVIHRDIKPSNVLVTEVDGNPVVKVIDFGVSKAIDTRDADDSITRTMQLVGTPQYMSPEQASAADSDLDTRTDVYSLGVMLYELATGFPPFDPQKLRSASAGQLERIIRETDPLRASARVARLDERAAQLVEKERNTPRAWIVRQLRGELDWIIVMAMDKARDRRYPSAFAFYEDVQRLLNDEMVHARPPSKAYAVRKMISRNKAWTSVGVLAIITLVSVSVISLASSNRLRNANMQIQSTLDTREQVLGFTEQMLRGIDPAIARGKDTELFRMILDKASDRVNIELADTPEVEVRVRLLIGELYQSIGGFEESMAQYRAAASIGTASLGDLDPQTIAARSALGAGMVELSEFDDARLVLEEVYEDARTTLGELHPNTLVVLSNLAAVYNFLDDRELALQAAESLLTARIEVLGDEHEETMAARNTLALALMNDGANERASTLFERVLGFQLGHHMGEDHPNTLKTRTNLAKCYQELGKLERAVSMNEAVLQQKIRVLGPEHPSVLVSMVNLAMTLQQSGDKERSLSMLQQALSTSQETLGETHQYTLIIRNNLGNAYAKDNEYEQAIPLLETACEGMSAQFGDQHPMTIQAKGNLADVLIDMRRYSEALEIAIGIRIIAREIFEESDARHGMIDKRVGLCYQNLGQKEQALPYLRAAAESFLAHEGDKSDHYLDVIALLDP